MSMISTRAMGLKRLKNKIARLRVKKAFADSRSREDYYEKELEKMKMRLAKSERYQ